MSDQVTDTARVLSAAAGPHYRELSRRVFTRNGIETEELVVQWDETKRRVMWYRPPLSSTVVGGHPSPVTSQYVTAAPDGDSVKYGKRLAVARGRVAEMYDAHYVNLMSPRPTIRAGVTPDLPAPRAGTIGPPPGG